MEVGQDLMRGVDDSPQQGYQRERWWHMVNVLGLGVLLGPWVYFRRA